MSATSRSTKSTATKNKPFFNIQQKVSNNFIQPNLYKQIQTDAETKAMTAGHITPHGHGTVVTGQVTTPVKSSVQAVAPPFYPVHLQQAYKLSGINTGAGQLIAIVDAYGYPNAYTDLYAFCQQFNLSKPNNVTTLQNLLATPATGTFNFMVHPMSSPIQNDPDWSIEQALDIQWAHVSAPAASILLVQAKTESTSDLFAAINYAVSAGASVVSLSWGMLEGSYETSSSYQQLFNQPNVTFVASSGDAIGVYYPSVSPYIVCAGGTSLTINATTTGSTITYARNTEKVWYNNTSSAEGCGISKYVPIPSYQTGFTTSKSSRTVPDIVCNADPNTGVLVYNSYYSNITRWYQIGGTSLSSPFMAGIIAAANAARVKNSKAKFSSTTLLQALYQLLKPANSATYSTSIYDVTVGTDNGNTAKVGYDIPSGVGAPVGDALISYLANY